MASAAIATGCGPGEHHIPSMNWFHRGEERYVEYGSSLPATRAFGIVRSLYDTVYNMNLAHLSRAHKTVFEHLDDAGLRTACTTYLIYRGRTRHDPSGASVYRRIAEAAQFRHPVYGARELFYADLFDSRDTGCTSALGMPGQRDRHTGCVGAYLVEHDLFDFLLFSLPDNDTYSHKVGPDGQVRSIAEADRALERIMHVAGGARGVPRGARGDRDVGPLADRGRDGAINLVGRARRRCACSRRATSRRSRPSWRPVPRRARRWSTRSTRGGATSSSGRAADTLLEADGVELVITRDDGEALVRSDRGELRFAPGGDLDRPRAAGAGRCRATRPCSSSRTENGEVGSETYPDALGRLWSALRCPHSGDVLVSAELGYEFVDWGGADHVGGGSHGSLHRDDSEGVLLLCGLDPPEREQWSLADVTPLVLQHFGVPLAG